MIELDGNFGEGGGALVRVALALSALTGQEFTVKNIRAGKAKRDSGSRNGGGLKPQHLHAIRALEQICAAETNKVEIGSTELYFRPGKVKKGIYDIDIGTAGSISLLLQALLLPCMFAPGKVTLNLKGGTCGKWQAPVDYIQNVLFPEVQRFVEKMELKVFKRGYYPKGGGEVKLEITPRFHWQDYIAVDIAVAEFLNDLSSRTAKILLIEQGKLEQIRGLIDVSADLQEQEVGERVRMTVERSLKEYGVPVNIRVEYAKTLNPGGNATLWAIFSNDGKVDYDNPVILGADQILERGTSSEQIGKEMARKLREQIKAGFPVDYHLADQLIPFMALLPGSEIRTDRVSNHALTNIYVVEKFLPVKFTVEGNKVMVNRMP